MELDGVLEVNSLAVFVSEALRCPNPKTCFGFAQKMPLGLALWQAVSPIQSSFNQAIPKRLGKMQVLQTF